MAKRSKKAPAAPANTLIAYTRVSTAEQSSSGLGLKAQETAIRAHAAVAGADVVGWFSDEGVSAKTMDRPQLGAALAALRAGQASGLVVSKVDRLSRSLRDLLAIVDVAEREGWRLVALDLGLDTGTPSGRFTLSLLGAVGELERNLISERTRNALAEKRREGVRLGRPTTLDPAIADRIAAWREQGLTLRAIVARLEEEGIPTARGGKWQPATVNAVLDAHERGGYALRP